MGKPTLNITVLDAGDTARALAFYADYGDIDTAFLRQGMETGQVAVVLAAQDGADIGGFYLNYTPKYDLYRRLGLPELQDLRVRETHRRQGLATALVTTAEGLVQGAGYKGLGISVGLHGGFGAAQRLYVGMGYEPDGQGVTYDRAPVTAGAKHPVDGDLALMLLKFF